MLSIVYQLRLYYFMTGSMTYTHNGVHFIMQSSLDKKIIRYNIKYFLKYDKQ